MAFIPHGKGDFRVNDSGQEVSLYNASGTASTVRMVIQQVSNKDLELQSSGLRPDIDLVGYVKNTVTVQAGWRVVWNAEEYEIIEKMDTTTDLYKLLLVSMEHGVVDLDL